MKVLELGVGDFKDRGHHGLGRRTQLLKVISLSVDKVARVVVLGVGNGAIALKEGCCWIASFPERLFFCFVLFFEEKCISPTLIFLSKQRNQRNQQVSVLT